MFAKHIKKKKEFIALPYFFEGRCSGPPLLGKKCATRAIRSAGLKNSKKKIRSLGMADANHHRHDHEHDRHKRVEDKEERKDGRGRGRKRSGDGKKQQPPQQIGKGGYATVFKRSTHTAVKVVKKRTAVAQEIAAATLLQGAPNTIHVKGVSYRHKKLTMSLHLAHLGFYAHLLHEKLLPPLSKSIMTSLSKKAMLAKMETRKFNRKLIFELCIRAAIDACIGLHQIHIRKCVHCDVTPKNILVNAQWKSGDSMAFLADLGVMGPEGFARSDFLPRAYRDPHNKTDSKQDIYSLGLSLLEIFTQQKWTGTLSYAQAKKRCEDLVPASRLRSLLMDMVRSEREKRPSAESVARRLVRVAKHEISAFRYTPAFIPPSCHQSLSSEAIISPEAPSLAMAEGSHVDSSSSSSTSSSSSPSVAFVGGNNKKSNQKSKSPGLTDVFRALERNEVWMPFLWTRAGMASVNNSFLPVPLMQKVKDCMLDIITRSPSEFDPSVWFNTKTNVRVRIINNSIYAVARVLFTEHIPSHKHIHYIWATLLLISVLYSATSPSSSTNRFNRDAVIRLASERNRRHHGRRDEDNHDGEDDEEDDGDRHEAKHDSKATAKRTDDDIEAFDVVMQRLLENKPYIEEIFMLHALSERRCH